MWQIRDIYSIWFKFNKMMLALKSNSMVEEQKNVVGKRHTLLSDELSISQINYVAIYQLNYKFAQAKT